MRYVMIVIMTLSGIVYGQSDSTYMTRMALKAGIRQPIPVRYASMAVKRPIRMDSLSLVDFRQGYIKKMQASTVVEVGGTMMLISHILIVALVPHFNRDLVISLAAIGIGSMTAGSILLPIGASERHRYKKSLRISLAQRGM